MVVVKCDKCGHEIALYRVNIEEIRRDDITVQYFSCPACLAKYHVCTTNPEMRQLIMKRVEIQNSIAESPNEKESHRLKNRLDKIIAQQKKLMYKLEKCGRKILEDVGK